MASSFPPTSSAFPTASGAPNAAGMGGPIAQHLATSSSSLQQQQMSAAGAAPAGSAANPSPYAGKPSAAAAPDRARMDADLALREQDRFLPIANISRIMKRALPASAKCSREAKETVQECVSEFISFVTSEASDKVLLEKRKTVTGDDVLWAMSALGFEPYVAPLQIYLQKYRDSVKNAEKSAETSGGDGKTPTKRRKVGEESDEEEEEEEEDDDE